MTKPVLRLLFTLIIAHVASASADSLYATQTTGNDKIEAFDVNGNSLGTIVDGLSTPYDVAFDAGGTLYLSHHSLDRIDRYDLQGNFLGTFAVGLVGPGGIAIDAADNVFVSEFLSGGQEVEKFDAAGNSVLTIGTGILVSPWGLAFDSAGRLYVVDDNTGRIERFDATTGAHLGTFATPNGLPRGLAIDSADNVYVSKWAAAEVRKYAPNGQDLGVFAAGIPSPWDIAIDANDNVYIAGSLPGPLGSIEYFAANGTPLGTFASNLNGPIGLSWGPDPVVIPIPASLGLLFSAFPIVVLRRSRVTI